MTRKDLTIIINKIEKEFDVQSLEYKGIKIWPVIRTYLHLQKNIKILNTAGTFRWQYFIKVKRLFSWLLRAAFSYFSNVGKGYSNKKKIDFLFISSAGLYNQTFQQKKIHKFFDPLIYLSSTYAECQKIEWSLPHHSPKRGPFLYRSEDIDLFLLTHIILEYLKRTVIRPHKTEIKNFYSLKEYLSHNDNDINIEEEIIIKRVERILTFRKAFIKILSSRSPKIVFTIVCASKQTMGLALACSALQIELIEIQHGQQGDNNLVYAKWLNYPKEGYKTLPKTFWVWGAISAKRIQKWAKNAHEVVISGNPWIAFYKWKIFKKRPVSISRKKNILVATQYLGDFKNSFLIQVMEDNDPDIFWYIRLHPINRNKKSEIKEFLNNRGIRNFDLEEANNTPLFRLFEKVDFNVTFWSTVAYEADVFDVKNIIIHPTGKESMKEYLKKNVFTYADSKESFIHAIENHVYEKPESPYILSDIDRLSGLLKNKI